ncbi:MAG: metal ABC transporter ATP-binding protein [Verrucomicrobia bacterium]|nr:metal ABC transporter ATP-binding protein [Verrucomicrobiota bacterium]NDE63667.1 metal ABC transporter ATP-binding protein [Chlamydiota bacterium]
MGKKTIKLENICVYYGKKCAIWDISLELKSHTLTGILGPNGSGKSTLVQAILGLIPTTSGKTSLNGATIAYVPQKKEMDLDFPISIFDLVMMGSFQRLNWLKWFNKKEKMQALSIMESLGISEIKERQIQEVSGGQLQRAIVARALLQDADFYILDEPFTGIDFATEKLLIEVFRKLRDQGKGVILVHHDLGNVEELFDHVIMVNSRLVQEGPTKIAFNKDSIQKTYADKDSLLEDASALFEKIRRGIK